ncbi:DUF3618 domain-containing protein [Falsirhodobacter deserti]|uniref:DUF3618 domain-containing protein n=1 Tax=Falsirhodobacter deserti TaxID=1365611 RepID=UPI000FE33A02|nr:DUF3618 domain-containing protein [Falsirhodobacter deserti]
MSESPKSIEAEVEANRANVEGTLNALRDKASVQGIMNDVSRYVGINDARGTLEAAGRQVNANPVAFGLIGLGLACLATGIARRHPDNYGPQDSMNSSSVAGGRSGVGARVREYKGRVQGFAGQAQQGAHDYSDKAKDGVNQYTNAASEKLHAARDNLSERYDNTRHSLADRYESTRTRVSDLSSRASQQVSAQPLIFGAVALVAGAVLGAALPKSNAENRWLGPSHDRLAEGARDMASELKERATAAAEAGLNAASHTAQDEGLVPDEKGSTVAEKVQHVAEAAVEGAKEELKKDNKNA